MYKDGKTDKEIAGKLNRSRPSVTQFRLRIGLKKNGKADKWTEEDINKLKKLIKQGLTDKEIAKKLDRTKAAVVQYRINQLGHKKGRNINYWKDSEINKLLKLYLQGEKYKTIADKLNRNRSSVTHKIQRLGLPEIKKMINDD